MKVQNDRSKDEASQQLYIAYIFNCFEMYCFHLNAEQDQSVVENTA